jgi:aryl-alcohol dehydrogenase-like predicted oxidoreductase
VAPPYGDGQAEALLGSFLGPRRQDVVICTKLGIAPPTVAFYKRLFRPLARSTVKTLPWMRPLLSRARAHGQSIAISPDRIEAMVRESLKRLKTDYIDVLALHEPTLSEAVSYEIHTAIERLIAKGMVLAVSVAGTPEVIRAGVEAGYNIDVAQFSDSPFDDAAPRLRNALGERTPFFITHGVYGSRVNERISRFEERSWAGLCTSNDRTAPDAARDPFELLGRFAFSNNPGGVVLVSMFTQAHIDFNAAIAAGAPRLDLAALLRRIVSQSGA